VLHSGVRKKEEVIYGGLQRQGAAPSLLVSREKSGKRQRPRAFYAGFLEGSRAFGVFQCCLQLTGAHSFFAATAPH